MFNKKQNRCYDDEWFNGVSQEEGREEIQTWRRKRIKKLTGVRKTYHGYYKLYSFDFETLYSFIQNFNIIVILQMFFAGIIVHIFNIYDISFDVHVSLFISPIVFPLAFSIHADFQRREKVLEDLAVFKSSGMVWFFCMREWKQDAGLDNTWISAVHGKLKSLLFHLREYLLTYKIDRRSVIVRAMYEDFSDINQLIDKIRASKIPANTALISRAVHLLNMMCLSFERLRVIREYRSPRSIRSFNKVLIFLLPVILGPYFIHIGKKSKNTWQPYYISVLVTTVFSSLQSVQDTLDNPFTGMSEDDIHLDNIDEWTFNSLEATVGRSFNIGRFTVKVETNDEIPIKLKTLITREVSYQGQRDQTDHGSDKKWKLTNDEVSEKVQKLSEVLKGKKGDTCITRQSLRKRRNISENNDCPLTIFGRNSVIDLNKLSDKSEKKRSASFADDDILCTEIENINSSPLMEVETNDTAIPLLPDSVSNKDAINVIPEDLQGSYNIGRHPFIHIQDNIYPSVDQDSKNSSAALLIKDNHTNNKFHVDTFQDIINSENNISDTHIEEKDLYSKMHNVPSSPPETNDNLASSHLPCGVSNERSFETSSEMDCSSYSPSPLEQIDNLLVPPEKTCSPRTRFNVASVDKSNPVKEITSDKDGLQTSAGIDDLLIPLVRIDNVDNKFHVISIDEPI